MTRSLRITYVRGIIISSWSMPCTTFQAGHWTIWKCMIPRTMSMNICCAASARWHFPRQGCPTMRRITGFRIASVTGLWKRRTRDFYSLRSTTGIRICIVSCIIQKNLRICSPSWSIRYWAQRCPCLRIARRRHSRCWLRIRWGRTGIMRSSVISMIPSTIWS